MSSRISSCSWTFTAARVPAIEAEGFLRPAAGLDAEALPSVMRKCVAVAQAFA